jgi:hypothetical protein
MGCTPRPRGLPAASSRRGRATIGYEELIVLIDQIYEAALDGGLWPGVLIKLADAIGAAHVSITSRDRSANTFASITLRTDPDFVASYRDYLAFHNPLIPGTVLRPVGEIYSLDSLMAREDFSATPVCNEWWLPSGRGLGSLGANLLVEDQFSALICVANAPDEDGPTVEQTHRRWLGCLSKADRLMRANLARAWRPRRRTHGPARSPPTAPSGDGDTASIQSPARACSLDRRGAFRRRCHGERPR